MGDLIFTVMFGGSMVLYGLIVHYFLSRIEKENKSIELIPKRKEG